MSIFAPVRGSTLLNVPVLHVPQYFSTGFSETNFETCISRHGEGKVLLLVELEVICGEYKVGMRKVISMEGVLNVAFISLEFRLFRSVVR